jgi:hypothetical protein
MEQQKLMVSHVCSVLFIYLYQKGLWCRKMHVDQRKLWTFQGLVSRYGHEGGHVK